MPDGRQDLVLINKKKIPGHIVDFAVFENHNETERKRKVGQKLDSVITLKTKSKNRGIC